MKPHREVNTQTISRWIKTLMRMAGVKDVFSGHSVRHASTSKAKHLGVGLQTIMKTAFWKNALNFKQFYYRTIETNEEHEDKKKFADAVLSVN